MLSLIRGVHRTVIFQEFQKGQEELLNLASLSEEVVGDELGKATIDK